jgi:hypothetical protein
VSDVFFSLFFFFSFFFYSISHSLLSLFFLSFLIIALDSFDRSANGSISVAEFASLIKTLGGLGLSKRQVYRLASSMDADFDRTVQYNEFMEYFLVIWVERLRGLRREAGRPDKSLPEIEQKRKMIKAKRRLKKAEHAIKIT